jgi:hypothetical protein
MSLWLNRRVGRGALTTPQARALGANEGEDPLVIVEVQRGVYIGEDDNLRFPDDYGGADSVDSSAVKLQPRALRLPPGSQPTPAPVRDPTDAYTPFGEDP